MTSIKRTVKVISVFILLSLIACTPSDFELPAYQANLFMPILDVNLSMENLILADTSEILQEDSTGLVSIVYQVSDRRKFKDVFIAEDIDTDFTLPGINSEISDSYTILNINAQLLDIDEGVYDNFPSNTYNFEKTVDIDEFIVAEFNSGTIGLELTNELPLTINAGAVIEFINKNETQPSIFFNLESEISPGDKLILDESDLSNKMLTGSFTFRITHLSTAEANNVTIEPEAQISSKITFNNISFKRASIHTPTIDLPSIQVDIPLEFSSGALIKTAKLNEGKLSINIPELNSAIRLKVTFLSILQNGAPLTVYFGANYTEISLQNMEIDFSTLTPAYNMMPVEVQLYFDESYEEVEIEFEKPLDATIGISDMDYGYLRGYLGKSNDVMAEKMDIDFFERIISGSLIFNNPQINISIENQIGATALFIDDGDGLYITGSNERLYGDKEVTIGSSMENLLLEAAPSMSESAVSTLVLNAQTEPNFNEYMAILPSFLDARIPFKLGTDSVDFSQFIDADKELGIELEIVLPLNLAVDDLYIIDTSAFQIEFDDAKLVAKSGIFLAHVESFYPIELNIQNYFLDENKEVIDSLFDDIKVLYPAKIDENGVVTESFMAEYSINVSKEDMERLRNTAYAVSSIRMQSPHSDFVRLLSSYRIEYKLTGEIQTYIDLN